MNQSPSDDERPLAIADLMRVIRRSGWKIVLTGVLGAVGAGILALRLPVTYEAHSTFRTRGGKSGGISSGNNVIGAVLAGIGGSSGDEELISLLKSRRIMTPAIEELGLQAVVTEKGKDESTVHQMKRRLLMEFSYRKENRPSLLPDYLSPITAQAVVYADEDSRELTIAFDDNEHYQVLDDAGRRLGNGHLNEPFISQNLMFTLVSVLREPLIGRTFQIALTPLPTVVQTLAAEIKVKPAEDREKILKITFQHPNRFIASHFLNRLLDSYQQFGKEENKRFAEVQLDYLRNRQNTSLDELQALVQQHASGIAKDLVVTGILDTEKELEFLLTNRQLATAKQANLELERRRLQSIDSQERNSYNSLLSATDLPSLISTAISQLKTLQEHRDTLGVALQVASQAGNKTTSQLVEQRLAELQAVRARASQTDSFLQALQTGSPLPSLPVDHPAHSWLERLQVAQASVNAATPEKKLAASNDLKDLQDSCEAYLKQQLHLARVSERLFGERIANQHESPLELHGLGLESANSLYVGLVNEQSKLETTIRQNAMVRDQLQDPAFEVSSLAGLLNDPVTAEIITQASKVVLNLKDSENRSEREKERLRDALAQQRAFLAAHLDQSYRLMSIQREFLRERIQALQRTLLDLTQQQISVSEKQLHDFISARGDHIQTERGLLDETEAGLRQQMALLPARWAADQILLHRIKLNKSLVEEVARLVESKNIANNLEVVQSAPVDLSLPPVLPNRPSLFLFAMLGALLGGALSTGLVAFNGVRRGFEASPQNLALARQHVAGFIGSQGPERLEALRRMIAHLDHGPGKVWLLMMGSGPDYTPQLASLLAKSGKKVLVVSLAFNKTPETAALPGLLQFLEGHAAHPAVQHRNDYDEISAGGVSSYGPELVLSGAFEGLLTSLGAQYDAILLASPERPDTAAAESLAARFRRMAVTLSSEKLCNLEPLMQTNSRVSFLFNSSM